MIKSFATHGVCETNLALRDPTLEGRFLPSWPYPMSQVLNVLNTGDGEVHSGPMGSIGTCYQLLELQEFWLTQREADALD